MEKFYDSKKSDLREKVLSIGDSNEIHEAFLKYVGDTHPNKRILDIGTGNGYILSEIEKRYSKKYNLYGIDISHEMLNKARKLLGGKARLYLADNNQLPFSEGFFASVTAKNVTNFSPTELARVLEDEGLFIFREYGKGKGLVEIANYFIERLIRSREPEFYVAQLTKEGFENIELQKYQIVREYTLDELIGIIQIFPFIKDLSRYDIETIKKLFEGRDKIIITSDPFILTARRKKR